MPPSGAPPPPDRFTEGVLRDREGGTLPVGGATLYRWPWMGALVGAAMMVGGLAVSGSAGLDLMRWGDGPQPVSGPIGAETLGDWIQWNRAGLPCSPEVVVTPSVQYRPVRASPEQVVWIASTEPLACEDASIGVVKPAVRAVRDSLDEAIPGVQHRVLWTRSGPANSTGLVAGGLLFAVVGMFVGLWFSLIGRRVRDVRHPQVPGTRGLS